MDIDIISSSDDDFDDEQELPIYNHRRPRTFRPRINFDLHPIDSRKRFRLTDDQIEELVQRIRQYLEPNSYRNHALIPEHQLRLAIRYLASGSYFNVVGDAHGVDKATVSRKLHKVVEVINNIVYPQVVDWPQDQRQMNGIINDFYDKAGMPSVIGCVDGSHFKILAPSENEPQFVSRHGGHSINGMLVCGPAMRFFYVLTKWPGSVHDARVFRNSTLRTRLETGWRPSPQGILLGDSAYPDTDYLISPIDFPQTQQERRFNQAHRETRVVIECAIGLLKQRFRCLGKKMHFPDPAFAAEVIRCCTALHNLLITQEDAADALSYVEGRDRADHRLQAEGDELDDVILNRKQELIALF